MIKNMVKRGLRSLGYEVRAFPRWKPPFGFDAFDDMQRLVPSEITPVIFDVGANVGQSIAILREHFRSPFIHSFEPSTSTFHKLQRHYGNVDRVTLNNFALGSICGKKMFVENSESVMSSFLEPGPDAWGEINNRPEVTLQTIDNYCEEKNIRQIDVLKIDTQGYEMEVLRGAERMLSDNRIHLVYLEVTFSKMYHGLPTLDEIYRFLLDRGFRLVSFYEFRHMPDGIAHWTDAMFVNGSARQKVDTPIAAQ